MKLDTQSELNVDVEASISRAYDTQLSLKKQDKVREHLAYMLTKLREPNNLIGPVQEALKTMQSRTERKFWYQRPLGIVALAVIATLIAAWIAHWLGWNK